MSIFQTDPTPKKIYINFSYINSPGVGFQTGPPPTRRTTLTVLGPDGFAAGRNSLLSGTVVNKFLRCLANLFARQGGWEVARQWHGFFSKGCETTCYTRTESKIFAKAMFLIKLAHRFRQREQHSKPPPVAVISLLQSSSNGSWGDFAFPDPAV